MKKVLVTGGAGFIGSAVVRQFITETNFIVINLDKLTYAGNLESLSEAGQQSRHRFEQVDICNINSLERIFREHKPDAVMHLAAESHVDRSIDGPAEFIQTNIVGTSNLLEIARQYWSELRGEEKNNFRFHHVSTDEVYGDLGLDELAFTEETPYAPNSPYSASKASSDHLVRAWHRTYGLPVIITNCSNNYGPYQFPEKLIPLMILNALEGKFLPVYGDGQQIRDWLYVEDHAHALRHVINNGIVGETYNIGGNNEQTNLYVVESICEILDKISSNHPNGIRSYKDLITFVADRPGHDLRYAIDTSKIERELGWTPQETFETGLLKTVNWYIDNKIWWQHILDGSYQRQRLGLLQSKY